MKIGGSSFERCFQLEIISMYTSGCLWMDFPNLISNGWVICWFTFDFTTSYWTSPKRMITYLPNLVFKISNLFDWCGMLRHLVGPNAFLSLPIAPIERRLLWNCSGLCSLLNEERRIMPPFNTHTKYSIFKDAWAFLSTTNGFLENPTVLCIMRAVQ